MLQTKCSATKREKLITTASRMPSIKKHYEPKPIDQQNTSQTSTGKDAYFEGLRNSETGHAIDLIQQLTSKQKDELKANLAADYIGWTCKALGIEARDVNAVIKSLNGFADKAALEAHLQNLKIITEAPKREKRRLVA